MDDELDPLSRIACQSDLEHSPGRIGSNEHREVVELEHSEGISIGVKHVSHQHTHHSVLASALHDNRGPPSVNIS